MSDLDLLFTQRATYRGLQLLYGTVIAGPTVLLDGDTTALPSAPVSLVPLEVGKRVAMILNGVSLLVVGQFGEVATPLTTRAKMVKSGSQSNTALTWTQVAFSTSTTQGVTVDATAGTFTVIEPGLYDLFLHAKWQNYTSIHTRAAAIVLGTTEPSATNTLGMVVSRGDMHLHQQVSAPDALLAAGDVLTFWVRSSVSGSFNSSSGTDATVYPGPDTYATIRKAAA